MPLISVDQAISNLKKGDLVALPTETVYGLAGTIDNESSLQKIFSTKERPFFDPLIVHVKNLEQAQELAIWGPLSESLALNFWPGPLTLVLKKKPQVSDLITSGGPTVGLRSPAHPIAQEVLTQLGVAFAAPSANRFGHTSPTEAQHVINEFNNLVNVVDGGSCEKGIESTVIEVDEETSTISILRPGVISFDDLNSFLTKSSVPCKLEVKQKENAPGHLKNHYQPKIPLILAEPEYILNESQLSQLSKDISKTIKVWTLDDSPVLTARKLYKELRLFSHDEQAIFLQLKKEWTTSRQWAAVIDRLRKACHFYATLCSNDNVTLKEKN